MRVRQWTGSAGALGRNEGSWLTPVFEDGTHTPQAKVVVRLGHEPLALLLLTFVAREFSFPPKGRVTRTSIPSESLYPQAGNKVAHSYVGSQAGRTQLTR